MLYTWICTMAATLAINTMFVISLLSTLTWEQRAMFLFAAIILSGGLFFSVKTMRSLNKPH
jgi:hypothetical protein